VLAVSRSGFLLDAKEENHALHRLIEQGLELTGPEDSPERAVLLPGRTVIDNIVAEGDYVVVQGRAVDRMTTSGKPYNNTNCWIMQLVGGEIVQVDEYCDTELVTAVFGN
jgi:hypothetical protein